MVQYLTRLPLSLPEKFNEYLLCNGTVNSVLNITDIIVPDKNKTQEGKYHSRLVLREVRKNEWQAGERLLSIQT